MLKEFREERGRYIFRREDQPSWIQTWAKPLGNRLSSKWIDWMTHSSGRCSSSPGGLRLHLLPRAQISCALPDPSIAVILTRCRRRLRTAAKGSIRVAGRVLLDTNVVIAFFADDKTVRERVTQTHFVLSSIVLGELYYGARKSEQSVPDWWVCCIAGSPGLRRRDGPILR